MRAYMYMHMFMHMCMFMHMHMHAHAHVVHAHVHVHAHSSLFQRRGLRRKSILASRHFSKRSFALATALPSFAASLVGRRSQKMKWSVLLLQAAVATSFRLPPPHGHAAHARRARGHPVLSSPEEKEGINPLDKMGGVFKGGIEDAVKKVTGNEEYQFGDFTKSTVEGTKVGIEDAVKKVTGNEEYQCNYRLEPRAA